jgi:hypothetical protein
VNEKDKSNIDRQADKRLSTAVIGFYGLFNRYEFSNSWELSNH